MTATRTSITIALAVLILCAPSSAFGRAAAARVGLTEMTSFGSDRDGDTVTVQGEAIGEPLSAGPGHSWINVLDGTTAVGIVVPTGQVAAIRNWGEWSRTGDTVRMTGTFNQACDQHGGDLDVHATTIEIVDVGSERTHPVAWWKAVAAAGAALAAILLRRAYRRSRFRP